MTHSKKLSTPAFASLILALATLCLPTFGTAQEAQKKIKTTLHERLGEVASGDSIPIANLPEVHEGLLLKHGREKIEQLPGQWAFRFGLDSKGDTLEMNRKDMLLERDGGYLTRGFDSDKEISGKWALETQTGHIYFIHETIDGLQSDEPYMQFNQWLIQSIFYVDDTHLIFVDFKPKAENPLLFELYFAVYEK